MYGYPAPETIEEVSKGNVKLGGCIIINDHAMDDMFCKDCEFEWCVDSLDAEYITKLRFRYWSNWGYCGEDDLSEGQWAFEVFPDGTIRYYAYPISGRKSVDRDKTKISPERVTAFYDELLDIFARPWDLIDCQVCDGCSYQLNISYCDGRKKTFNGDIGGGSVDDIIMNFLRGIPEMREKIEGEDADR
jgi:hypothetical protein